MSLGLMACQSPTPSGPSLPRGCVEERAWPAVLEVVRERVEACAQPATSGERARCDREDYLESICYEINAYRRDLELDPELANFDVRFPWPAIQWIDEKLDLSPGHTGSESWADHLAALDRVVVEPRQPAVMNALTFGLAQRWYDARGFGSPPD
jgi:hypothetical protein